MKTLSLVYFGTPDFSAGFLEKILTDKELPVEVKSVITQEDKPVGRKQIVIATPVKLMAQKYGLPVETGPVASLHDIDLALLFAYGEIIPKDLLEAPKYGFWNIHPSLLPKYRGAAPVAALLINGDEETGVTIIQMDEEMDHGPIIAQEKVKILPRERKDQLTNRLTEVAFSLFKRTIIDLVNSQVQTKVQDDKSATYTKLLTKQDGYIEISSLKSQISDAPEKLFNRFRGLYPWPGLWTLLRSSGASEGQAKRLKITDVDLVDGKLILKKVQLEGKKETDFNQFNDIYRVL